MGVFENERAMIFIRMMAVPHDLDKVDSFYNQKFQKWLFDNSHEKERPIDSEGYPLLLEYDEKGFITNATFNRKTKHGLDLTEKDFLEELIPKIEKIDLSLLNMDRKKLVKFYKEYLMKKMDGPDHEVKEDPDFTIRSTHCILSYLFNCDIRGIKPVNAGRKKEVYKVAEKTIDIVTQNTFYKMYPKVTAINRNNESELIELCGDNWKDILIHLSDDPDQLINHFKFKQLQ